MDHQMNGVMAEKHSPSPIDYGVQIRFIDDLKEPNRSQKIRPKIAKPGSYGVAVRVQGIDGQPFVVLNSGEKGGDSFGVQIKGESKYGTPARNPQPEEPFLGSPGAASSSKDASGSISSDSDLPENPYAAKLPRYGSQYSTSDEEQGPKRRSQVPKSDSVETASSSQSNGSSLPRGSGYRTLPHKKSYGDQLRRTQSQGSLLSPDTEESRVPSPSRAQPVHAPQPPPTGGTTRSASMTNLTGRRGPSPRDEIGSVSGLRPVSRQPLLEVEELSPAPPANEGGDIDTKPLSSVDALINKFDGKAPQRGRGSRKSRVLPEDRKRSQSLDGRVPYHDTADCRELGVGGHQANFGGGPTAPAANPAGNRSRGSAAGPRPKENGVDKSRLTQEWVNKSLEEPAMGKQLSKVQPDLQLKSTPDLLKDQQELSQPGSSEHTKALIYGILKDGSTESESSVKRKTNLVLEKIQALSAERRQMEESLGDATDQEQELLLSKRSLESRLEEAQRSLARLSREHEDLTVSYHEEAKQKEQLKRAKSELEEEKRLLDKSIGKLTRELDQMTEESHRTLSVLQSQLEDYKEKSRKEITDSQKQAKDRNTEVEKMQYNVGRLQDEVTRLKQALQDSQAERENAVLDKELLAQRLHNLEQEMDSRRRSQDDRSRQVKALEDKSKRLEVELDEERNTTELLTERINRTRDQIDQLRAELLQERSVRQDLECDKISLERQNKDLKSRLASSEGLQKPSANISQLESRIQELQEKLQTEEREKSLLVSSNRKLERKVKELSIQIDDERQHINDQKDQLSLRVKALKRQVDSAEEEIERLEAARKKAQREVEEQHEMNEQLQNRIRALEKDLWRKAARSTAESSLKDDHLSSDEEFDSAYGPSSIASLLTEGNLQTSSC
ncbi:cingulin [Heteronotia binoei]|uniref:cingulin n=1 Tax=Heteronotia binoei TaxID=13085 RepID=UPI00293166F0|nr:cingulin [Heteronotia binoei]